MDIIKNGLLVTPEGIIKGDLAFENGKISALGDLCPGPEDRVYDAEGCWVFPGFIDQHTHLQACTGMSWTADTFADGTLAAVSGGTTTLVDFATQEKGGSLMEALEEWKSRASQAPRCNYAFHMAVCHWTEAVKKEIPTLRKEGVSSFKVYLAYDHLKVRDRELMELMEVLRDNGAILGCHCENGDMVDHLQAREFALGHTGPEGHPLSRPAEAEAEAISRFAYLGRVTGCPIYVVHLSSKLGLEELRSARARGQQIYAETCPQYLTLEDSLYSLPDFQGAKYVCSPPLRKPEDLAALREAVLAGEIQAIATDHCAFNFATQKVMGKGDFRQIPNGMPGIEQRPAIISTLLHQQAGDSPELMNRLLSEGPAKLMQLYPRKGALQPGSDADICVWDPSYDWTITAATQHQNVDYSPYEGFKAHGRAKLVFVNGTLAAQNGQPTSAIAGEYVKR